MIEQILTWDLGNKMIEFSPFETVIVYTLAILILSGLMTEYFVKIIKTKSTLTKVSSFLLLSFLMWHLVFIENNSLADSILILLALLLSFFMIIVQKILLWIKTGQIPKTNSG